MTVLTLRLVFHLPLRQTDGFVASIIRLMGLDLRNHDYTTLSRRGASVDGSLLGKKKDGLIHLVIDSTSLKMVGDGEWHAYHNNTSNRRLAWQKRKSESAANILNRMTEFGTPRSVVVAK